MTPARHGPDLAVVAIALARRAFPAALALLAASGGAFGQPVSHPEATDPLPWAPHRTYADLARLVVPAEVRHIDGEDMGGVAPLSVAAPRISALPVRSDGRDRMALLLDLGPSDGDVSNFVVLALFDMADEPRLLDAANVASDRHTAFLDPPRLPLGAGGDLVATRSTHFNSSQGYATTALILPRADRLELIDTISTFDDRSCAYRRTQELDIRQGAGEKPFADIVATVTERTEATGEDCGGETVPGPETRTITVTYRWSDAGQRYLPDSDAFVVLARQNEQRF